MSPSRRVLLLAICAVFCAGCGYDLYTVPGGGTFPQAAAPPTAPGSSDIGDFPIAPTANRNNPYYAFVPIIINR